MRDSSSVRLNLVGVAHARKSWLGLLACELSSQVFLFGGTFVHLLVKLSPLPCIALCAALGNLALGHRHRSEAVLAKLEFFGQVHAIRDAGTVGLFGQCQQLLYFQREVGLQLDDVPVRECAVARGVGVDLGAVQADRAQFEQLHLLRHLEYLHK